MKEQASWGNRLSTFQEILSQSNYRQHPLKVNMKYSWSYHNELNRVVERRELVNISLLKPNRLVVDIGQGQAREFGF